MRQVLDDFLGVFCLACSRFTPANRVEGVLSKRWLRPQPSLHSAPLWCTHEQTNTKRKQQQAKCEALESSLSLFLMAHQRPNKSRFITAAYPGHLAAFRAKCFRHKGEAAVDLGAKGTYMCSLEISLPGRQFLFHKLPHLLTEMENGQHQSKPDKEGRHSEPEGMLGVGGSC